MEYDNFRKYMRKTVVTLVAFCCFFSGFFVLADTEPVVRLDYYGEIGCSHCDLFAEKVLPRAEELSGITAQANYYDILSQSGYEQCEKELSERGYSFTVFPVLVIGNNVYQGNSAVEENLPKELIYFAEHGSYRPQISVQKAPDGSSSVNLAFIPVFLAGLVDGINPCAFATMLFFISWITLKGGGRRRILISGGSFLIGVFLAYLGIGFGLLAFLRTASTVDLLRRIVRYLFTILTLIFALLSFGDALFARRGKTGKMVLQLPLKLKKRIHSVIRDNPSGKEGLPLLLFFSFAVSGFIIALLELACTGQLYLPTIAYMLQSGGGEGSVMLVFLLLVYNLAFILPLAGILAIALAGVEQQTIRSWFNRNIAAGKLFMGLLFCLLAALIWFSGV